MNTQQYNSDTLFKNMEKYYLNRTNLDKINKKNIFILSSNNNSLGKIFLKTMTSKKNNYLNKNINNTTNNSKNSISQNQIQYNDIIFDQKDKLFWLLYIFENGIDAYTLLGKDKYTKEMSIKTDIIRKIKIRKKELKQFKIKYTELEENILYSNISILTLFSILYFKNINFVYYTDKICYAYKKYDNKETFNLYHDKDNNTFWLKDNIDIEKIQENRFVVDSIKKPIKAISYYKVNDIMSICKKLQINVMKTIEKKYTKKELYEKIIQVVG